MDSAAPAKSVLGLVPSLQTPGKRLVDAGELFAIFSTQWMATSGIVANGNSAETATPLNPGLNEVYSVTAANVAVRLPPTLPGQIIFVCNLAGSGATIFTTGSDLIIPVGTTVSPIPFTALASGQPQFFACTRFGYWNQLLSATS
jgi:hypothetical protein